MESSNFTAGDFENYKSIIQNEIETHAHLIHSIEAELRDTNNSTTSDSAFSLHMGDAAASGMERDRMCIQLSMLSQKIELLEKALERIHNKTYGICRVTGKTISRERLEALPFTDVCLEAARLI